VTGIFLAATSQPANGTSQWVTNTVALIGAIAGAIAIIGGAGAGLALLINALRSIRKEIKEVKAKAEDAAVTAAKTDGRVDAQKESIDQMGKRMTVQDSTIAQVALQVPNVIVTPVAPVPPATSDPTQQTPGGP